MIIKLLRLEQKNFKGNLFPIIDFDDITNIYGKNGTGKSSINDSFTWLLFDKDSSDISKFDVQPLDSNGKVIDNLETEVIGVFEIDGLKTTLRKVLKQKWVRKKGTERATYDTNTKEYYVNEVPYKEGEFKAYIASIIPENIFKLLTNPMYFGAVLPWKEKRKMIFDINGDVSIDQVINYNDKLSELSTLLNPNEDMESFAKRIKAQISKLKKDQEGIPARVDERRSSIKENIEFEALEMQRRGIVSGINSIDEQIADRSKVGDEILKEKSKIYELKNQLQGMDYKVKQEMDKPLQAMGSDLYNIKSEIQTLESKQNNFNNQAKNCTEKICTLEKEKASLLEEYHAIKSRVLIFDESKFVCPTCKRDLDISDIETTKQNLTENFNLRNAEDLKNNMSKGTSEKEQIEVLQNQKNTYLEEIETIAVILNPLMKKEPELESSILNFKAQPVYGPEYEELKQRIADLETKVNQPISAIDTLNDLKDRKNKLQIDLKIVDSQLAYKAANGESLVRIDELNKEEKRLGVLISSLEGQEFLYEQFVKSKVELLEDSINSRFKFAKIMLFRPLQNGGIEECCEVMVNGVPFSTNLNTGAKFKAGLDIINTLSQHYNISAPIFFDNRESVDDLIDTNSQIINLIVSKKDRTLRIENNESEVV